MKITLERRLLGFFILIIIIVSFLAWTAYSSRVKNERAIEAVQHTEQIISLAESVLSLNHQVEAHSRGYILTGDQRLLKLFDSVTHTLGLKIDALRQLTYQDEGQKERVQQLYGIVVKKVDFSTQLMNSYNENGLDSTRKMVLKGTGIDYMSQIRKLLSSIQNQERILLKDRQQVSAKSGKEFLTTTILQFIAIIIVIIGTYAGLHGALRARRKVERQLSEREQLLESIIDNTSSSFIYVKDLSGRYLLINKTYENLFTKPKHEILGRTVFDLVSQDSAEQLHQNDVKVLQELCFLQTEDMVHLNGEDRYFYSVRFPLYNAYGKPYATCGVLTDITEIKRQANRIQEVNDELESFTYSVSHDLRAPLRVINGYADIIATDYENELNKDVKTMLASISANVRRMGQLIDDLLNFSRLGRREVTRHHTDMSQVVATVLKEQVHLTGRQDYQIVCEKLEDCNCDSSLVKNVWENLISNALKYSGKKEHPEIRIGSIKRKGEVEYFITDNGAGFDMRYYHKLFGVFQRLHKTSEYEGTGVGLALAQRIVKKHGGNMWAVSEIDKGSSFHFTIPT